MCVSTLNLLSKYFVIHRNVNTTGDYRRELKVENFSRLQLRELLKMNVRGLVSTLNVKHFWNLSIFYVRGT